jgi:hypothetical protein
MRPGQRRIPGPSAAVQDLPQCREYVFSSMFVAADDCLADVLTTDPNNEEARLFRSMTRLVRIVDEPGSTPFRDLVEQFDGTVTGGIEDLQVLFPEILPGDSPTGGDVQDFTRDVVVATLSASIDDLGFIQNDFSILITQAELVELGLADAVDVEFDYGDAVLFESALRTLRGLLLTFVLAHDLDVDIDALSVTDPLSFQYVLQS